MSHPHPCHVALTQMKRTYPPVDGRSGQQTRGARIAVPECGTDSTNVKKQLAVRHPAPVKRYSRWASARELLACQLGLLTRAVCASSSGICNTAPYLYVHRHWSGGLVLQQR
eukprot:scaffold873_cov393-Prasinococcus_capsulatus_cf.AAC.7